MEKSLDFKVILYILRKKIAWILIVTIIGAMAAYLFSTYMLPERFSSSGGLYISNTQDIKSSSVEIGEITAARGMASTYSVILQTDKARHMLRQKLAYNEDFLALPKEYRNYSYSMSVDIEDETEVLIIKVTSGNPKLSAIVCHVMIHEVAVDLISEIFPGGKAHPLTENIRTNNTPVSPNIRANMLIGGFAACIVICIFFVIWALLDNRVKDEQDFVSKIGIPVLGEVPCINEISEERKGGYYYAYSKK